MNAALLGLAVLASLSVIFRQPGLVQGHDLGYEIVRLVEYKVALAEQFPPRLAPDLYGGYGSPIFVFYPPLFLLLTSLVDFVLDNWNHSVKVVVSGLAFVSAWFTYRLLGRFVHPGAAWIGTLVSIFTAYRFTNLYGRNAYAEYAALCLLPVLFRFLLETGASGRVRDRAGVFVATALLALSHNIGLLVGLGLTVLAALYCAFVPGMPGSGAPEPRPATAGAARRLLAVLVPSGAGLGAAGFFLLPAFLHRDLVRMEDLLEGKFQYGGNFVSLQDVFFNPSVFYYQSPIPLLILAGAVVVGLRKGRAFLSSPLGALGVAYTLIALLMVSAVSEPLWRVLPLVEYVQFPWRFLLILPLSLGWAAAYVAGSMRMRHASLWAGSAVTVGLILLVTHWIQYREARFADATSVTQERVLRQNMRATVRDEYLPRAATSSPPGASERQRSLGQQDGGVPRHGLYRRCGEFSEPSSVEFALWNFPFWEARLDGAKASFLPDQPLLKLEVPPGEHCVEARLSFTRVQWAGFAVSILAIAFFTAYAARLAGRRRR